MRHPLHRVTPFAIVLLLGACNRAPAGDAQGDIAPAANAAATAGDPAMIAALRDQIMVDPALVQQANADAIRPPTLPYAALVPPEDLATRTKAAETDPLQTAPAAAGSCPQCEAAKRALTLGALAQTRGGATGQCAAGVGYSAIWATRLPSGVPLYPDAQVIEAAGADAPGYALRIVSFVSTTAPKRMLDWYYTKTRAAGFSAQHQADADQHILAGTHEGGGAFMVIVKPRAGGGSAVDLMADGGG